MVHTLVNHAMAQRAVWMRDVALAFHQGEHFGRRVEGLMAAFRDPEDSDPGSLKNLKALADSVPGPKGDDMRKRVKFLDFCARHGIEARRG